MSRRDTIENAAQIARLGLTPDETAEIMAISRALRRIGERHCNGYWDEAGEARDERAEARKLKRAAEIAEAHGLKVYHQGDPRGCALYLYRPEDLVSYNARNGMRDPVEIDSVYNSVGVPVYA